MAVSIDFWDSTVHGKKHIMAMKAVECVREIKFHQHVIIIISIKKKLELMRVGGPEKQNRRAEEPR